MVARTLAACEARLEDLQEAFSDQAYELDRLVGLVDRLIESGDLDAHPERKAEAIDLMRQVLADPYYRNPHEL